jgi:hypothetical protein
MSRLVLCVLSCDRLVFLCCHVLCCVVMQFCVVFCRVELSCWVVLVRVRVRVRDCLGLSYLILSYLVLCCFVVVVSSPILLLSCRRFCLCSLVSPCLVFFCFPSCRYFCLIPIMLSCLHLALSFVFSLAPPPPSFLHLPLSLSCRLYTILEQSYLCLVLPSPCIAFAVVSCVRSGLVLYCLCLVLSLHCLMFALPCPVFALTFVPNRHLSWPLPPPPHNNLNPNRTVLSPRE